MLHCKNQVMNKVDGVFYPVYEYDDSYKGVWAARKLYPVEHGVIIPRNLVTEDRSIPLMLPLPAFYKLYDKVMSQSGGNKRKY